MRQTRTPQLALGEARIEDIKLDHKSRDDIPAVLLVALSILAANLHRIGLLVRRRMREAERRRRRRAA